MSLSLAYLFLIILLIFIWFKANLRAIVCKNYYLLIFLGILLRVIASTSEMMYPVDVNDFKIWSELLYKNGLSEFYTSEHFTDYPPGYMYVLYIIGFLKSVLNLDFSSNFFTFIVKFPAIFCDVATGIFLYKLASKRMPLHFAWFLSAIYLFNPAVILDSSIWGQTDAVYTIVLLFSVYYIASKSYLAGFLIYAVAILIKPQAFIFAPIYIYSAYEIIEKENFSLNSFFKVLSYAFLCFLLIFMGILPFTKNFDFMPIINQYKDTLASYSFGSVNAYNFYALVGGNWQELSKTFLGLSYKVIGVIFINLTVFITVYLLDRNNRKSNFFFIAGLINAIVFVFVFKMHERYLFPTIAFFLFAFIYNFDKKLLLLYIGFSFTFYINCFEVLKMILNGNNLEYLENLNIISAINIILLAFSILTAFMVYKKIPQNEKFELEDDIIREAKVEPMIKKYEPKTLNVEDNKLSKMTKKDYLIISLIMLIYSIIAFYNLGNKFSPKTLWDARIKIENPYNNKTEPLENAFIDLGEEKNITSLMIMNAAKHNQKIGIYASGEDKNENFYSEISLKEVFAWNDNTFTTKARYLRIVPRSEEVMIYELAFKDESGNLIPVANINDTAKVLVDEQDMLPDKKDFMNSTYFDEIYHARTAYEFLNSMYAYENTHPPLGKVLISLGISLFGMNPFGYRVIGTTFGVLMIFAIYVFAKKLLKTSFWATFCAILMATDFMHFAQTRIATIDTYIVFFVILMYLFMYEYFKSNFFLNFRKTLIPLALSGICMGLAIASKWTGIYAGAGLAVIFFATLFERYKEYNYSLENNFTLKTDDFNKNALNTCVFCVGFFIVIPIIIYCLSYIPYLRSPGVNPLKRIWDNQVSMFNYHTYLESEHPFSSKWYTWIIDKRPIFYFSAEAAAGVKKGISSFGNPLIWWTGLVSFCYCIFKFIKKPTITSTSFFFITAYLAQILPWVLVSRTTYIYHYFPCVPFIILMTGYMFKDIFKEKKRIPCLFLALSIFLFVLFYPVISGKPIRVDFVYKYLQWFSSWQLI